MVDKKRVIIVLESQEQGPSWDNLQNELAGLSVSDIHRSDESGLAVVTGNVPDEIDMHMLLTNLNGMSAIRNAEEDGWSFSQ